MVKPVLVLWRAVELEPFAVFHVGYVCYTFRTGFVGQISEWSKLDEFIVEGECSIGLPRSIVGRPRDGEDTCRLLIWSR
jgi:hypothetical protein